MFPLAWCVKVVDHRHMVVVHVREIQVHSAKLNVVKIGLTSGIGCVCLLSWGGASLNVGDVCERVSQSVASLFGSSQGVQVFGVDV